MKIFSYEKCKRNHLFERPKYLNDIKWTALNKTIRRLKLTQNKLDFLIIKKRISESFTFLSAEFIKMMSSVQTEGLKWNENQREKKRLENK